MKQNRLETSKKILGGCWAAAITLSAITIDAVYKGLDSTNVATLASLAMAAWSALAVAHGFYFWKAKNENRSKGAHKLIRELAGKYGIEAVARLAEIIYKA